ncbi:MAG: hypothetical protein QOI66_758 [Myxococcales bacterium]|jgi:hypothetical protein|nr:hypothetical protein [Myxococcales bacterium]
MDDQMNPEARRMIDQIRSARTPSAGDKERIRKALAIGVAVTAASVPGVAAGASAAKAAATVGIASGFKVAVSVVVLASVGAGAYLWTRPPSQPAAHRAPVAVVPVAAPAPPPEVVDDNPVTAPTAPAEVVEPTLLPSPPMHKGAGRDPLMTELALLHRGQQAWRQGNAARALELAQQHARRYPHSALALERDALRVFALCSLGQRAQARPLAADLLRRAPGSPLRTSVEESCGGH